ncbi:hypothetical protein PHAVU_004G016466 [Phaseolus vulgaris]
MADIISDFPDSVLCYILSFLPTKEVVTTSVLSKRWKLLWRLVPSFDFDLQGGIDDDKEFCSGFFQSLYSFLLFRDKRQLFHRFRLKCFCFCNHSGERIIEAETINVALLKSAMNKNGRLEHLDLNLYWRLWVPSPVFRCKTLVVLKLANLTLKDVSFVDLPLLKILHLNYVYFEQDDLPQFLSGTPNLEDLLVNNMTANSAEKFHRLPNLIDLKDLVFDLHNLVQLELTFVYCKELVEVLEVLKHCPKLQTLVISTYDDKV